MKRLAGRTALALAVATSLAFVTPLMAAAKTAPVPVTMVQAYHVAINAYNHAKMKIDRAFHQAMEQARLVEIEALSVSQGPAQSLIARAKFNVARATAITTWDSALKKLGTPPKPSWISKLPIVGVAPTKDSNGEG